MVYNFVALPEDMEIDHLFSDHAPSAPVQVRDHLTWGHVIGEETLLLDTESAITEIKMLLENNTNREPALLERRLYKAATHLIKTDKKRLARWERYDDPRIEEIRRRSPYHDKTPDQVVDMLREEIGDGRIYFFKTYHEISDNSYNGRECILLENDEGRFINGKNAPVKVLFSGHEVVRVEWCYWSDQSDVDEFFDELDIPPDDALEYELGIKDKWLREVAKESYAIPDTDLFMGIIRNINYELEDQDIAGNEELCNGLRSIMQAWTKLRHGSSDAETIIDRLGKRID